MKKKFCCICGREGDFVSYTCPSCLAAEAAKSYAGKEKQKKAARVCKSCGRVFRNKRWVLEPSLAFETARGAEDIVTQTVCPDCRKEKDGFYEAIIQFSGNFEPKKKEIESLISKTIERERLRGKAVFLTKKEGNQYFFNNIRLSKQIVIKMVKIYRASAKETSKLVGFDHMKGEGKYKVTTLLNIP